MLAVKFIVDIPVMFIVDIPFFVGLVCVCFWHLFDVLMFACGIHSK